MHMLVNFILLFYKTYLHEQCTRWYTKLTSVCTVHAGFFFNIFLQNLPACALFMLVSFFFFLQNLLACALFTLVNFLIKKNWIKVAMIIWDPSSKHFYYFSHFSVYVVSAFTICASPISSLIIICLFMFPIQILLALASLTRYVWLSFCSKDFSCN